MPVESLGVRRRALVGWAQRFRWSAVPADPGCI